MTNFNYILRGGREYSDVTVDEMQKAIDIFGCFYGTIADIVYNWDQRSERISVPYLFSSFYEACGDLEALREKISARKEEDDKGQSSEDSVPLES